jgi:hypothetical protein
LNRIPAHFVTFCLSSGFEISKGPYQWLRNVNNQVRE